MAFPHTDERDFTSEWCILIGVRRALGAVFLKRNAGEDDAYTELYAFCL